MTCPARTHAKQEEPIFKLARNNHTQSTTMKMIPSLLLLSLLLVTPLWADEAKPNLNDPETRERILDGAKDDGELEWRGEAGEELAYFPNSKTPYSGWLKRMHENGQVNALAQIENGLLTLETMWYENGQRASQGVYKNGLLISASAWQPDSTKCPFTNLENGNGLIVIRHQNGQKNYEINYKGGKMHGLMTWWHENGQKSGEANYKDGKEQSVTCNVRTITVVEEQITYGQFATRHGASTTQLDELNGLSLSKNTTLTKGSELYVPIPSSQKVQQKNRGEDLKPENTEKIESVPAEAIQGENPDEKGAKEISDSKDNRDDDTNTDGYFISPSLNAVHIRYSNKVNGYKVEALWSPTEIEFVTEDDFYFAKGPAIIKLIHEDGGIITVVNNYFTLRGERIAGLSIEYKDGTPVSISKKELTLHYSDPQTPEEELCLSSHFEPFFFYDVTFDGKKELILVEDKEGQRHRDAYKAYEISSYDEELSPSLYQITHQEPFIDLDRGSTIDRKNKTITHNISGGAWDSYQVIYTLNTDESRYRSYLGWTKSKIHLEYNKYPEPPEGIEKLDEMPEQIIGKIKRSPDGKKDYFLTSGLGDSHALHVYFRGFGQDWYSYVSPALDFWPITKGKHKGNVIIELREEDPATSVTGSSNWLWMISPYGEKLQPLGPMDSVDWGKMEAIYGVKR